ncbi:hypothetical protein LCGC14_1301280 [marine sediment metagenome]
MRNRGYLVLDGNWLNSAFRWLYSELPMHQPIALLMHTDYHGLAEKGPILIQADPDSEVDQLWQASNSPIGHAVWLETSMDPHMMTNFMRARLQVLGPAGARHWLRLGDSRPLLNAYSHNVRWPELFWQGIDAVWLKADHSLTKAWEGQGEAAPIMINKSEKIQPYFSLDSGMLRALALMDKELEA